jgi:hypothetical protein
LSYSWRLYLVSDIWAANSHKKQSNFASHRKPILHSQYRVRSQSKIRKRDKRLKRALSLAAIVFVTGSAMTLALPAIGQDSPESLLPPGFGDPPPPAPSTPRPPRPTSGSPVTTAPPTGSRSPAVPSSGSSTGASIAPDGSIIPAKPKEGEEDQTAEVRQVFDVPPAGRRSLGSVGIISDASGGFAKNVFGQANGTYLANILRSTKGPLASRWGTIMTRRLLASRTDTPRNVNAADWVGERAWLLLRMGDAVTSRQLVQQVDAGRYSKRLYEVAMQTFLANGDLGGMCPLAEGGAQSVGDPAWKMARPICASLAGEQGTASSLLNQARNKRWMVGIDYLLAEKAVGAGTNGRRSVKIEWEKVTGFNAWRHGLANATGIEPPARLYAGSGAHLGGWLAQMPMLSVKSRIKAAPVAASLGVISNRALVDLYAQASEDADAGSEAKAIAGLLETAYSGSDASAKVTAMASIWDSAKEPRLLHANMVLTARAAALIAPSSSYAAQSDRLVASMMTAGFDRSAARWADVVGDGSLGWGLLAVGSPGMNGKVSLGQLGDFQGNDNSTDYHKSALLLAGLAGLDRVEAGAQAGFIDDIDVNILRTSRWSKAITEAAGRGEQGTVVLLAAAGMQGSDWTKIPAQHLYFIVKSLRQVGLEAEARMIAAEAVTFG